MACNFTQARTFAGCRRPVQASLVVRPLCNCRGYREGRTRVDLSVKAELQGDDGKGRVDLTDPSEVIVWGGNLPSRRRLTYGALAATSIILGGNLGGVTSFLLGQNEGRLAHLLGVDRLIPINGYKRCVDDQYGFEFSYPGYWLADQTLYARQAQQAEAARSLDPLGTPRRPRRSVVEPLVAFGPAGTSGEANISLIAAPVTEGFRLELLGGPEEAAQRFLDTTAAPLGSDKVGRLLGASSFVDEAGTTYYQMEFTIKAPTFFRHNVSALAAVDNLLYTLNAQAPEGDVWEQTAEQLRRSVSSLRVQRRNGKPFPTSL